MSGLISVSDTLKPFEELKREVICSGKHHYKGTLEVDVENLILLVEHGSRIAYVFMGTKSAVLISVVKSEPGL
jgi:hypothetical protein